MKLNIKESSIVEFKSQFPEKGQLAKTCIAFCNHYGGRLFIGVKDNGEVLGLPEEEIEEKMEFLGQFIYQTCSPPIVPQLYSMNHEGLIILVIEVSPGINKPYFLTKEGVGNGTYIRVGRSNLKASAESIQELQWKSQGVSFDALPCYQTEKSQLEKSNINQGLGIRSEKREVDQSNLLKSLNILVNEHGREYVSNGGVLLFHPSPQDYFSEAFIICTRFKGMSGREALHTQDMEGTIYRQIEGAIQFVTENIGHSYRIDSIARKEQLRLPLEAIREAIINAIIHRNYNHNAPLKVAIYQNRVEVFSPGGFPGPILPEQYEDGLSYIRNPIIAKVLRRSGYVEKLGSGLSTIFKSCRTMGLVEPEVIDGGNYVKVVLYMDQVKETASESDLDTDLKTLLQFVQKHEKVNVGDLIKVNSCSRATIVRRLNALLSLNKIEKNGKGRGVTYRLKS